MWLFKIPTCLFRSFLQKSQELVYHGSARVVDVVRSDDDVVDFNVSSWLEGVEGFAEYGLRVVEAGYYEAEVDVVEVVGEFPGSFLGVLAEERYVGEGGGWLDWGEVCADDAGLGVIFGCEG